MSGGIVAIRGFDYQATVTLDRLLAHFDRHGASATVRPEGVDDFDLGWVDADGSSRQRFEQVKKPREDQDFNPTGEPWTVADIANSLLPDALEHLASNDHEQVWILGDAVTSEVDDLLAAGSAAPSRSPAVYWRVVHHLARSEAIASVRVDADLRAKLLRWRAPSDVVSDPQAGFLRLTAEFRKRVTELGASSTLADEHAAAIQRLHARLPDVLRRTRVESLFGSEEQVALRVQNTLEMRYGLDPSIAQATLFRNLRGFINDIAKQAGRRFDQAEFEAELRSVWPTMMPVREPPPLGADHIPRTDLTVRFTTDWSGNALEVLGISGSGKTTLAAEVCERSRFLNPDRHVVYGEVRPETTFRDLLVGVAFHLRRFGLDQLFGIATVSRTASDSTVETLARAFSALPKDVMIVADLVQGTCNEAFARDLAAFVRFLRSGACRIALLGQESAFRELNELDRDRLGVGRLNIRGFNYEEFVTLVSRRHAEPDRSVLHEVFTSLTAGRAAGLYARLARSLAEAPSLETMRELARRPADDILERAEQERFNRVSAGARPAAEKLVCFALPFARPEAEEVFPEDNVGAALRELLSLGLLRASSDASYEMHETVRAGLEGLIGVEKRRAAHSALAAYYARRGDIPAEVFHLERAAESEKARERARAAFLRGERWAGLAGFVTAHDLVTPIEVLDVVARSGEIDAIYLLGDILRQLSRPVDAREVMDVIRSAPERFGADYPWSLALAEACLRAEPAQLQCLIEVALGRSTVPDRPDAGLSAVLIAARRCGCTVGDETIAFFERSGPDAKRALLPLLLAGARREALAPALRFMSDDDDHQPDRRHRWPEPSLRIESRGDAAELLAALPDQPDGLILALRSSLLGSLAQLVWRHRGALRPYCIDLLRSTGVERIVRKGAIRVLTFLAEPRLGELCEDLAARRDDQIHGFAAVALTLAPTPVDSDRYEAALLDSERDMQSRLVALAVPAGGDADLGTLYERLRAAEAGSARMAIWDFMFLQLAMKKPFAAALPLLDAALSSSGVEGAELFVGTLTTLARLRDPAATSLLAKALVHSSRTIRIVSGLALGARRSRAALPDLRSAFLREDDPGAAVQLAVAIVASGASSVEDLLGRVDENPTLLLWQCVLAARTRDAAFAPRLIALANDRSANWQLRRAAIDAAACLPFEVALNGVLPVLRERSPLTIDDNRSLHTHGELSWLLQNGSADLRPAFVRGRCEFTDLVGGILEQGRGDLNDTYGIPPNQDAADWLYDRLALHGWPQEADAPDKLIGELHVPLLHSALMRGLRRASRTDLIEAELAGIDQIWLATRCLLELARSEGHEPYSVERLRQALQASALEGDPRLEAVLADLDGRSERTRQPASVHMEEAAVIEQGPTPLGYDEAVAALTDEACELDLRSRAPLVLGPLTAEQFDYLVRLADPINDRVRPTVESYIPSLTLRREGHVVAQWSRSYSGRSDSAGSWIRPALAAANHLARSIPWHVELLSESYPESYAERLLACLAEAGDADAFYRTLDQGLPLLLPSLCSYSGREHVMRYVDERIVPFLNVHLQTGTDEIFEGLCAFARAVETPAIDQVLAALLRRWTGHFDQARVTGHVETNHHFWRAFHSLTDHPRFKEIEDWFELLSPVLQAPLACYHKQSVTRVVERDPRSYIQLESMLFKQEDWAPFYEDEIDRLQKAVEGHFPTLSP